MKSKIHKMTEEMTTALGPIFQMYPDYSDIKQAVGLVVARIAQATPMTGLEMDELKSIIDYAEKALPLFLDAEQTIQKEKAVVAEGIDGFAGFSRPAEPIKEGSIGDYPSNPNTKREDADIVPQKPTLYVVEGEEPCEDAPEVPSDIQE